MFGASLCGPRLHTSLTEKAFLYRYDNALKILRSCFKNNTAIYVSDVVLLLRNLDFAFPSKPARTFFIGELTLLLPGTAGGRSFPSCAPGSLTGTEPFFLRFRFSSRLPKRSALSFCTVSSRSYDRQTRTREHINFRIK
jgi:hypothetical protein